MRNDEQTLSGNKHLIKEHWWPELSAAFWNWHILDMNVASHEQKGHSRNRNAAHTSHKHTPVNTANTER